MDNKTVVRRFLEEVVNTGDLTRVPDFVSPDCRPSVDSAGAVDGIEGMRQHVRDVRTTFPDLRLTIERQIAEGEWVATHVTARGTHVGSWLGMKPTRRPVAVAAVNLDRVVDGRIVEHGGAANMLEALLSIGALRPVGPDEP